MAQSIRYLKSRDGVRLAWTRSGEGPTLVKAGNWLSHLKYDLESPLWRHWIEFFSKHYRFIRYDERGCGMSQWEVEDLSPARWDEDLAAVVEESDPGERFILFGLSQGVATAIAYAAKHPERVSQLILYGGYVTGWACSPESDGYRRYKAIVDLARLGWGKENPAFRQLFTAQFVPGATAEQMSWFNDLCQRTTTPEIATRLLGAGQSNSQIGAALFISEKTVRNSLTRVFEKLHVRTRTQAAVLARDHGFSADASG